MADLSVPAASVRAGTGAVWDTKACGATVVAGEVVYLDAATGTLKLADANGAAALAAVKGIALHDSLVERPLTYQTSGEIILETTPAMTKGHVYVLSANPGKIAPQTDLATGWAVTQIIRATGANTANVEIKLTGMTV